MRRKRTWGATAAHLALCLALALAFGLAPAWTLSARQAAAPAASRTVAPPCAPHHVAEADGPAADHAVSHTRHAAPAPDQGNAAALSLCAMDCLLAGLAGLPPAPAVAPPPPPGADGSAAPATGRDDQDWPPPLPPPRRA